MATAREMGMTADDVRSLFEQVERQLNTPESGRREYYIFKQVYGDTPKALDRMAECNQDVTTCPEEVIIWLNQQLAPQALAAD